MTDDGLMDRAFTLIELGRSDDAAHTPTSRPGS